MTKREINVHDYAKEIMSVLSDGVLLTTKAGDEVNTMTIGWGMLGVEWRKDIFITYVRESRYTAELLAKNPEFTVNIPLGNYDKKVIGYCGTKSKRDTDKIQDMNLTLVESDLVSPPAIAEFPLTLECKVIYKRKQQNDLLPEALFESCYPENIPTDSGMKRDYHIEFYGEIVKAYILE